MKKQKWMMMGVTAVVCSALFVPGAFAKPKDDSYVAPAAVLAPAVVLAPATHEALLVDVAGKTPTYGPVPFFAPPESEDSKN